MMLAKQYTNQTIDGWLISEKLDGVRALWDGENLISRNNNIFNCPHWFSSGLPKIELDGELYISIGQLQKTAGIIHKKIPIDAEWKQIKFYIIDAPDFSGGFLNRHNAINQKIAETSIIKIIKQTPCQNVNEMNLCLGKVIEHGGEGIVLREPQSIYEDGRSNYMLKLKPKHSDEATVIGFTNGNGRFLGKVGSLVCIWRGEKIIIGTGLTDSLRTTPPAIGATVTFEYLALTTTGLPREPVFIAVRNYE